MEYDNPNTDTIDTKIQTTSGNTVRYTALYTRDGYVHVYFISDDADGNMMTVAPPENVYFAAFPPDAFDGLPYIELRMPPIPKRKRWWSR